MFDPEAAVRAAGGAEVVYQCTVALYDERTTKRHLLSRHIAATVQSACARFVVVDNVYAVGATVTFDKQLSGRSPQDWPGYK